VSISAMKQALDTLERLDTWLSLRYGNERTPSEKEVIRTLRQAIEQAEKQEPVAIGEERKALRDRLAQPEPSYLQFSGAMHVVCKCDKCLAQIKPKREEINLTVDELIDLEQTHMSHDGLTKAIEAKLKEKNA
jgi:hypothetical protein